MTKREEFVILKKHAENMLKLSEEQKYEHGIESWKSIVIGLSEEDNYTRDFMCWIVDRHENVPIDVKEVLDIWREE
ncbi:MAG: hypothetical protein ACRCWG_06565 [Sarcina sp.]